MLYEYKVYIYRLLKMSTNASLNCVLAAPEERSQIIFSTAHHQSKPLRVLFGSEKEKIFFDDATINTHYKNITFSTFEQYTSAGGSKNQILMIADVPTTFEILQSVIDQAKKESTEVVLILLKINKKYLNMLSKKLSITPNILTYSPNKFVGINDKLREFVEQSYDLNRAGFYAYGAYLNYFRANLLKKIFRTDQINVAQLARSFGYSTPPRVKEGTFLTEKARKEKKMQKVQQKKIKKIVKQALVQKNEEKKVAQKEGNRRVKGDGNKTIVSGKKAAIQAPKIVNTVVNKTKKIKKI